MGAGSAAESGGHQSAAFGARCQLRRLPRWPLAALEFGFERFAGNAGEVGEFSHGLL
jgi:hypothetical protein